MPTQNTTSLAGVNKAITANAVDNAAFPRAIGAGPDGQFSKYTDLGKPATLTATSNDLNTFPTGNSGLGRVGAAGQGTGINAADLLRKLVEVEADDNMLAFQRGINSKTGDRNPLFQASGFRYTQDGRIVSATGAIVVGSSVIAATGNYAILSTSGDQSVLEGTRTNPVMDYTYRVGLTNVERTLPPRTQ